VLSIAGFVSIPGRMTLYELLCRLLCKTATPPRPKEQDACSSILVFMQLVDSSTMTPASTATHSKSVDFQKISPALKGSPEAIKPTQKQIDMRGKFRWRPEAQVLKLRICIPEGCQLLAGG